MRLHRMGLRPIRVSRSERFVWRGAEARPGTGRVANGQPENALATAKRSWTASSLGCRPKPAAHDDRKAEKAGGRAASQNLGLLDWRAGPTGHSGLNKDYGIHEPH